MKDRDSLLRSTSVISVATIASRVLGLVRDALIASTFGSALRVAFLTAFIIPNTLRRLFAEGALSAAFIPVFTECLARDGRGRAAALGASLLKVLFVFLLLISLLGSFFAPQIFQLLPEGKVAPEYKQIAIQLLSLMFPYILLIGLSAVTMGMLNSLGKFFAPAISPALLNLAMIGSILLGSIWFSGESLIRVLAVGVLLGGCLQFLVQYFPLQNRLPLHLLHTPLWDPKLNRVLTLMLPLIIGQAITEINILISTGFAWKIQATDFLFFSNRVIQFPLGVFGIAIATATFPRLSRDAVQQAESRKAVADTAVYALRKILFIMIPSAVGLILVGRDILGAIFDHGKFHTDASLGPTYQCALYYSLGLPAFAMVKIIVSAFYARQNPHTPMLIGAISVFINIILIFLLIGPLQAGGLALATTLASYVNLSILTVILSARLDHPIFRRLIPDLGRSGLCSLLMAIGIGVVGMLLPEPQGRFVLYLLRILILLPLGMMIYALFSWRIQPDETRMILQAFRDRLKKK